ncbi:MAG: hypothetical protein HY786_01165, partial [Deltaproteobacteria bacterium]|nr:hypothetical protein [Deltaproteobacteria bacterium]
YYLVGLEGEREITIRAKGFKKIDRKVTAVKGEISKIDIVLEPEEGKTDK